MPDLDESGFARALNKEQCFTFSHLESWVSFTFSRLENWVNFSRLSPPAIVRPTGYPRSVPAYYLRVHALLVMQDNEGNNTTRQAKRPSTLATHA